MSSHLLPGVGGEVEHEHGEEGDAHAGDDEVHGVEQSLAPYGDVEGDVQVGLVAARVDLHVPEDSQTTNRKQLIHQGHSSPLGGHGEDVPLDALVELGQVYPEVDHRQILDLVLVSQVDLDRDIDTSRAKQ